MQKKSLFFLLLLLFSCGAFSQTITQTIRGHVVDTDSKFPLFGAVITVMSDSSIVGGANSNDKGEFIIEGIPVGRVKVNCALLGYGERKFDNLMLTSAKELILEIDLEQSAEVVSEVEIKATRDGEVMNEMATVSARQFSVSETERYAGSRGDPARMASNFAGVQGADDSRNDIVIRGNSPQGVLWRMEGVDIPNPNHFNIPGTAGGPVSIINNKYLANSDFYTGAFPAEYGNSISGVFDLRMRNGNNQKHEFSGQFGFLGTEAFAEGPINKAKGSSYIASYRYSTLKLFSLLGIEIGTDAIPQYQDGAFRLFFPGKKNNSLAIWGIGGASAVDILISQQKTTDQRNIYGNNDRDQYFKTRMGIVGLTYSKTFSEKTFLKTTLALMTDDVDSFHQLVFRHIDSKNEYSVDSLVNLLRYNFRQTKLSSSTTLNYKVNPHFTLKIGANIDVYHWNMMDSVRASLVPGAIEYTQFKTRWNGTENGVLVQPYASLRWKLTDNLSFTAGLHGTFFSPSKSFSVPEPRLGLKYSIKPNQTLSFGLGRHSQLQPLYMYFYRPYNDNRQPNNDMGFTKSDHLILSYQIILKKNLRILSEIYYQKLFNVPVEVNSSSFSLLNTGAGFSRFFPGELMNTGRGRNYGIELTIEKFFNRSWLFLFTASLFDSKYTGSDGVQRNTDFNGKYALNILGSREWRLNQHSVLNTGLKITTAGGRWYGPADINASNTTRELVFADSLRNSLQFKPYFRLDLKINYKINRPKVNHEIGLDLVNILNTKNVLKLTYAPDENNNPNSSIREEYQLGFLPLFYYKIDF
jgi:hypothetical protein